MAQALPYIHPWAASLSQPMFWIILDYLEVFLLYTGCFHARCLCFNCSLCLEDTLPILSGKLLLNSQNEAQSLLPLKLFLDDFARIGHFLLVLPPLNPVQSSMRPLVASGLLLISYLYIYFQLYNLLRAL